jgi:hypothetical protein
LAGIGHGAPCICLCWGRTFATSPDSPSSSVDPVEDAVPVADEALDRKAQADAHLATAAALTALLVEGPGGVTPEALSGIEPTLIYVDGPSRQPGEASVYENGNEALGIAVMSGSGTCFWIMHPTEGEQKFGSGMPCTGRAALQASDAPW